MDSTPFVDGARYRLQPRRNRRWTMVRSAALTQHDHERPDPAPDRRVGEQPHAAELEQDRRVPHPRQGDQSAATPFTIRYTPTPPAHWAVNSTRIVIHASSEVRWLRSAASVNRAMGRPKSNWLGGNAIA